MPTVFISYRRSDASASAGRLCDWLKRQFGEARVFLDTEKIAPGDTFPKVLEERLAACDVILAVIGPAWVSVTDAAGHRRIDDAKDFVRLEVATALARGSRIIPVLVGGSTMPSAGQLPPPLQGLAVLNAVPIDDGRFAQDFDNLVDGIMGRARGFARRELDRLQRGVRVLKASSLVAPLVALIFLFTAWMQVFDAFLLDTKVASYSMWLGERFLGVPTDSPVTLIAIDEETEKRLGNFVRSPGWRENHAKLIDRLVAAGVTAIAFDLFVEKEAADEIAADAALAKAIANARDKGVRVIFGIRATEAHEPKLLAALTASGALAGSLCIGSRVGYAFNAPLAVSPESRGKRELRAANPAISLVAAFPGRVETIDEERREVSVRGAGTSHFAAYSVLDDADEKSANCPALGEGRVVATLLLRLAPSGFWRESKRRLSYAEALDPATTSGPDRLKGKIALVGVTQSEDTHRVVRGWKSDELYGVELHADAITSITRGIAVRPLGPTAQWLLMLLLAGAGAAMSFLLFDRPPRYRRAVLGVMLAAYVALGVACYLAFAILLNMLYDIVAFAAAYVVLRRLQVKALAQPLGGGSP